ncbi:MAG: cation transporter [Tissierellia bacterium]|nr:cation transporter [Tissierellia bacterium]
MAHDHKHNHGHHHHHDTGGNIGIAFILNLSFTIIEIIGGYYTNSIAIISDAVHDLGDSLSLGLAWYFQKISQKDKNKQYTYGYKRFSLLGAIINSIVLVVGSMYILTEALPRLFTPQETNSKGMFILAIIGIVINGAAVLKTSGGSSINERVVSLHLLEDVLGWVAVLVGSIIMHFTGLTIIDPILSILIACFVLINVVKNIKGVIPILLQGTPIDVDIEHIVERLGKLKDVSSIHDFHIWSLDEEYNILTIHIKVHESKNMLDLVELKREIRTILQEEGIQHATIEFELPEEDWELLV